MVSAARRVCCLASLPLALAGGGGGRPRPPADPDGDASAHLATTAPNPGVQAAFADQSYAPGSSAVLRLRGSVRQLRIGLFRAAAGHEGPLQGAPVTPTASFRSPAGSVTLHLGSWPSGLYYARVTTPGSGSWYAPFVLRPARLGVHRVLVVLPTNTWQAYNFEDGDSWYADAAVHTVLLTRPFVDGGVPPHYRGYDRGFLRWLVLHHEQPDFASDDDLDAVRTGESLARAYTLIVFPGHEE